ncbi:P1 family peptidase [Sciscionella sediminilitoris]|uniref:P1 family peptidase n=1 Tax=Sciscionella sediminilitoris TaxID=1445613 RepID=UPI0004DF39B5|nr:P1 family peptidase [Sciscionella sp. SE31]
MSGSITDVDGIEVGQHQRLETGWATGTTVVRCLAGATGGVDSRGGAPGTRETDLLAPQNLVQRVHAVCLSGGSAYGLAPADGVMRWLGEHGHGLPVGTQPHMVVPIVPAAVLFDLPRSDWGNRPGAEFGYRACAAAGDRVEQGTVGAGTGATTDGLKGGIGTASTRTASGYTVGALVAVNAAGRAVDAATGRPYGIDPGAEGDYGITIPNRPAELVALPNPLNTTIGVVATDASLDKAAAHRLAMSGQDGLARAVRPAHSMFDGDTVFAMATGTEAPIADPRVRDELGTAAAEVFTSAMVHGLLAATGLDGVPAYRDVWPEAFG